MEEGLKRIRLVVLDDYEGQLAAAPAMSRMNELAEVTVFDRPLGPSDFENLKDCQVLLALRERTPLDERFFAACPNLELVLQTGGHAYHLDQAAATRRGIIVALGRRVTEDTAVIAELVFALILGLTRNIQHLAAQMSRGEWPQAMGESLAGRILGILGCGRHGRPVAKIASLFGMKVLAWDRGSSYETEDPWIKRVPLNSLLTDSDIVSIHLRLSDASRGLMNRERLEKMKQTALLINTARGAIVDEDALVDALRENRIAGAGLDVFAVEPLPASSPLRTLPNVLLTPHIGWKVTKVLHQFVEIAADHLAAWLDGTLSASEVLNPEAAHASRERSGGIRLQPAQKE
ncbi:MAG: D-2-hydroxyacid dehydrogenase family protein [Desulfobacteraceae bacterium]|nr:MAG: D-2-hydroxyacid dehydrogenase family protein [Desulfobacteraceae bacterium]